MRPSFELRSLAILTVVLVACTGAADPNRSSRASSHPPSSAPASSPAEETTAPDGSGPRDALLYLEGRTLHRLELATGKRQTLGRLPSLDAVAAPGGESIAYVVSGEESARENEGSEDFVADPEVHVLDVDAESDTTIGPGLAPLWHPDGQRLAYLESSRSRVCEGETCQGLVSVVVADVAAEERRTILDPAAWTLLGWLGDRLVVTGQGRRPKALVVDESGDLEDLGIRASEFWGGSPDGDWFVRLDDGVSTLVRVNDPTASAMELDVDGRILAQGAWAPSGDRLGAVLLEDGCCGGASRLVLASVDGRVEAVPGSRGAEGPVLWGPDSAGLVYARATGRGGLRLEAVHCLAARVTCSPLFSWPRGITLLGLSRG